MEETWENASRRGIAPEANMENVMRSKEEEDLRYLYNFPKDFDIENAEVVKAFFKRMEALRSRREQAQCEEAKRREKELEAVKEGKTETETETAPETPEEKAKREKEEQERKDLLEELENKKWTRKECALAIGISEAMLSKYARGKVKKISRERLEAICEYFSTTPHYLFGLSSHYKNVLEIDRFGNIVYKKDGTRSELRQEFISYPILAEDAVNRYEALYKEHPSMFWSIHHLINAPEAKRKKVEIILEQLADF